MRRDAEAREWGRARKQGRKAKRGGPLYLRTTLKDATRGLHDALDLRMGPLSMERDLRDFLTLQYRARLPLEAWLEAAMDAPPPAQTPLLVEAMHASNTPVPRCDFERWDGDRRECLGIAWLLAGSSLGNRSILAHRRKAGLSGGEAFLGNAGMVAYWNTLRAELECDHDAETTRHAVTGAKRGFAHFLWICEQETKAMVAA